MHDAETWSIINRWRNHPYELMLYGYGGLILALCLNPFRVAIPMILLNFIFCTRGAGVPAKAFIETMLIPAGFLLAGSLTFLFSVSFEGMVPAISFASDGIQKASEAVLRSGAAVSSLVFIMLTVSVTEQMTVMRRLHFPELLTEVMGLVYRQLNIIGACLSSMRRAQDCRLGYSGLKNSFKSSAILAATLLIRAVSKASRMEKALNARAFNGSLNVLNCRHEFSFRIFGAILIVFAALCAASLI